VYRWNLGQRGRFGCGFVARRFAADAQFDHAQLYVVDRKRVVRGPPMKPLQRLARGLGLVARDGHMLAAPVQSDVPAVGDLLEVFIERAAEVGEMHVVAFQRDGHGLGRFCGSCHALRLSSDSLMTISPFSELVRVWVMRTSTICPIKRGLPMKFTIRLFSLRPESSLGSRRDGFSTRMRCMVPTMPRLMAAACSFTCACSRCRRSSFSSLLVL